MTTLNGRPRVLVTPRSAPGHPSLERLTAAGYDILLPAPGRTPTRDEQEHALTTAVGYVAGVEPIDADLLHAAPRLRVISRNGVGADAIDVDAAAALGIDVLRAPAANAQGVAELAIALILASARSVPAMSHAMRAGRWERVKGVELAGRTLGIVGCGQIGRRVARVAIAIGMEVLAYDAFPDPEFSLDGFRYAELGELLRSADIVSLHAPPGARPLIDRRTLAQLRPHVMLVNTARAALVDESAVLEALDDGRLARYAADVFEHEPPGDTPLTRHPSFIGTPHVGGYTAESIDRAMDAAVQQLVERLDSARGREFDGQ